jgi:CBS-domain-containing membrane protein
MLFVRVRELMSTPVTTLAPTDTLERAEDLMITSRVRHLPVLDGDVLVGLVSLSDLLAASISWLRDPSDEEDRAAKRRVTVSEIMRRSLETVQPDADATRAADVFLAQKISCLPVVDERLHLLGILTDADFVRLARAMLSAAPKEAPKKERRRVRSAPAPRSQKKTKRPAKAVKKASKRTTRASR